MTEKESEKKQPSMEEQFRELFRKANVSMMMSPGVQPRADAGNAEEDEETGKNHERMKAIREFSLKPRDVKDYLDRFVIKQDDAKKVLSVAICDHYNHVRRCLEDAGFVEKEYAKHNIILLGPSGVGKTYLMRCIARLIGVPFVKADATKFTETGYVGHDVEDLVRDLVKVADNDVDLAQYGIIYLDEIDKIAGQATSGGKDVSGRGVQVNLLKLMEDTDVSLFSQTDLIGQVQAVMDLQKGKGAGKRTINTRHILFIVSGSFSSLADQVRKRIRDSKIGFSHVQESEQEEGEYLRHAQTKDFIDFGFEPEFIGRMPVRVVCDALTAADLEQIMLKSEGSVLSQYSSDFEGYGIGFKAQPDAISAIADRAYREKTGARGLMTVLEGILRNFKFELPSTAIKSCSIDRTAVEDPESALEELLNNKDVVQRHSLKEDVRAFADKFHREHGIKLVFASDAVDRVVGICVERNRPVSVVCADRFQDLEYGLKLISRNTGQTSFNISRKFVDNPGEELSRRIAKSFKKD
jgi:ATP-dependent Clp protease ATP-binding subunit ClpX